MHHVLFFFLHNNKIKNIYPWPKIPMARLLTHHDPYHIHASCGLIALLHFIYRFWLIFLDVDHAGLGKNAVTDVIAMIILALPNSTSYLFSIVNVKKGNDGFSIWKEYRGHAFVFATKLWLFLVFLLYHQHRTGQPPSPYYELFVRIVAEFGTMHGLQQVTQQYPKPQTSIDHTRHVRIVCKCLYGWFYTILGPCRDALWYTRSTRYDSYTHFGINGSTTKCLQHDAPQKTYYWSYNDADVLYCSIRKWFLSNGCTSVLERSTKEHVGSTVWLCLFSIDCLRLPTASWNGSIFIVDCGTDCHGGFDARPKTTYFGISCFPKIMHTQSRYFTIEQPFHYLKSESKLQY